MSYENPYLSRPPRFPRAERRPLVPPQALMVQVLGEGAEEANFLYGGYVVAEGIRAALGLLGRDVSDFASVLEFGSGSGRVLRWFEDVSRTTRFHGSDISVEAIAWAQQHLPFAEWTANTAAPPLPFPDGCFDLVYSISVLTHLDEALQRQWLAELRRVARPGAVVLQTVHGRHAARMHLGPEEVRRFERDGFLYKKVVAGRGLHGLPEFYQSAYHTRGYVERVWSRYFDLHAVVEHGPLYQQELVVMTRPEGEPAPDASPRPIEPSRVRALPLAHLGEPGLGRHLSGPELTLAGWAFFPDHDGCRFDVWIDGERRGACDANESRPDVGRAFPGYPQATEAGFTARLPIADLRPGPHQLWLSVGDPAFPFLASYFVVD